MHFDWIEGKKIVNNAGKPLEINYWKLKGNYFLEIHQRHSPKGAYYEVWNKIGESNVFAFLGMFRTWEQAVQAAAKKYKFIKGLPSEN